MLLCPPPEACVLVSERTGRIVRFDLDEDATREPRVVASVAVDSSFLVAPRHTNGVMGLGWTPFGDLLVARTEVPPGGGLANRVDLLRPSGSGGRFDSGDSTPVLSGVKASAALNGGRMASLGSSVLLTTGYASELDSAAHPASRLGKVLKLDFFSRDRVAVSVYSRGHRNSQGLVVSPERTVFATEHGGNLADEVNVIEQGRDYGWSAQEGACLIDCPAGLADPLFEFSPTIGISGVAFLAGDQELRRPTALAVSSLKAGRLLLLLLDADTAPRVRGTLTVIDGQFGRLRDVVVARDGRILVLTSNTDHLGQADAGEDAVFAISMDWVGRW
jgi:glucose/arabinose dehydrogenase